MRIIDNKKVDLTNDEWLMYQQICRAYDRPNFKGEHYFKELFETNSDGIITFVRPPQGLETSYEVVFFLFSVMNNQHMRIYYAQTQTLIAETKANVQSILDKAKEVIAEYRDEIQRLKSVEQPPK